MKLNKENATLCKYHSHRTTSHGTDKLPHSQRRFRRNFIDRSRVLPLCSPRTLKGDGPAKGKGRTGLQCCDGQSQSRWVATTGRCSDYAREDHEASADKTQVVDPMGTNGWIVVDVIHSPDGEILPGSPEAQSFVGMMWAARVAYEQRPDEGGS